jgi:hypothetical protein
MSNITLMWNDKEIVEITKKNELFYSKINYENVLSAKEDGFPMSLLKQISIVSDELAPVIKRRIPNPTKLRKRIKFKDDSQEEIEEAICEYINETGCRKPTDKMSIKIEIINN